MVEPTTQKTQQSGGGLGQIPVDTAGAKKHWKIINHSNCILQNNTYNHLILCREDGGGSSVVEKRFQLTAGAKLRRERLGLSASPLASRDPEQITQVIGAKKDTGPCILRMAT